MAGIAMHSTPKESTTVTAYNMQDWLAKYIDLRNCHSFTDFECIMVDDCL